MFDFKGFYADLDYNHTKLFYFNHSDIINHDVPFLRGFMPISFLQPH